MRTIKIGDRKLSSMTKDELGDFIYDFGYCASDEHFNKPIFTEFEFYDNSIFFNCYQNRKNDGSKVITGGHLYLENRKGKVNFGVFLSEMTSVTGRKRDPGDFTFCINQINHFLKLGFDLPFYNS